MTDPKQDTAAGPNGSALSDQLGPPAQPRRYYCNKCGHMGEQGPEHDVCAGYPQQRCQYSAVAWGPFWSTEQLAAAVAAERERCAKVCESVASDLESAEEDAQAMSIGAQSCADQIRAGA